MSYDDGLITGLLLGSGGGSGGSDEPAYLNDPDYSLFQEMTLSNYGYSNVFLIEVRDELLFGYNDLNVSFTVGLIDTGKINYTGGIKGTETVSVDWGDGTSENFTVSQNPELITSLTNILSRSIYHTYSSAGRYTVIIGFLGQHSLAKPFVSTVMGRDKNRYTVRVIMAYLGSAFYDYGVIENILYDSYGNQIGSCYYMGMFNTHIKFLRFGYSIFFTAYFFSGYSISTNGTPKLRLIECDGERNPTKIIFSNYAP